jgi:Bacterial virulence protein (VirJ)
MRIIRISSMAALAMIFFTIYPNAASAQTRETVVIRGRAQVVHLYGERGGVPVIVASGDGGWIHLGPHAAEVLASTGHFVVGFDVKAYLESFKPCRRDFDACCRR